MQKTCFNFQLEVEAATFFPVLLYPEPDLGF
jgi:hypothetical protein